MTRSPNHCPVRQFTRAACIALVALCCGLPLAAQADEPVMRVAHLPPGENNPRNSEGDFIQLDDGRLLYVYTHFTSGAGDHASAYLASRTSRDGGRTWSDQDETVIEREGKMNVMSVSLLRLADQRIALVYLRKNSQQDCRPLLRTSRDEARTWSDPIEMIPERENGYYVLNNDRIVQLSNGRLIAPVAQHFGPGQDKWTGAAEILCYYSDDAGSRWHRGAAAAQPKHPTGKPVCQEPGVVQLKDRLMLYCRTNLGSQGVAYSGDRGETWSQLEPSGLVGPLSPATIERIPATGDLLAVWNDHSQIPAELRGKRTPFSAAISTDEGGTWRPARTLADNPNGWYCYTAMEFVNDHLLLGHCCGDRTQNNGLAESQITRVPVKWLYGDASGATETKPPSSEKQEQR